MESGGGGRSGKGIQTDSGFWTEGSGPLTKTRNHQEWGKVILTVWDIRYVCILGHSQENAHMVQELELYLIHTLSKQEFRDRKYKIVLKDAISTTHQPCD